MAFITETTTKKSKKNSCSTHHGSVPLAVAKRDFDIVESFKGGLVMVLNHVLDHLNILEDRKPKLRDTFCIFGHTIFFLFLVTFLVDLDG